MGVCYEVSLVMKTLGVALSLLPFFLPEAASAQDARMLLESERNTIDIYRKNAQAVVYVSNVRLISRRGLFGQTRRQVPRGAGSGIVWDRQGHIITNYHVGGRRRQVCHHLPQG